MSFGHSLHQRIEAMWWSNKTPPASLRLLSRAYTAINRANLESRFNKRVRPALPMISIGNISVGGSGKTPFVIWLVEVLSGKGFRPVVLCRGDGGKLRSPRLLDSSTSAELCGDEAKLLADACDCPVIAGRDRVAASALAEGYGDILILDDGFQYRQLERILDVVLIPTTGLGNGFQIPAGPLRENIQALERADFIVRTGNESTFSPLTEKRNWHWHSEPSGLKQICGTAAEAPKQCFAATAIARPERFFNDLRGLGMTLEKTFSFPDHHRFSRQEVASLLHQGLPVIVTGKDAVKLKPLWEALGASQPLWVLEQKANPEQGLPDALLEHILSHLDTSAPAASQPE